MLPGDDEVAVKDPVITLRDGRWEMWLCEHPLTEPGHEDRMTTSYLTSHDGLAWTRHGTVLEPTPGTWDARGARVTTVLSHDPLVVLYDGRPTAEENWHETTSVARGRRHRRAARRPAGPVLRSPDFDGALRYASAVRQPDGSTAVLLRAGPARRRARPRHTLTRVLTPVRRAGSRTSSLAVGLPLLEGLPGQLLEQLDVLEVRRQQ